MTIKLLNKQQTARAIFMMALVSFFVTDTLIKQAHASDKPRIVSMNLCTDQLVLLLADPEQILSLSYLSHDNRSSVYADQAQQFPTNKGLAEEVYILKPDITVTGTYSNWTASTMLETLGMRVERFEPAYQFEDIKTNISMMGTLLDQSGKADAIIAAFDNRLSSLKRDNEQRPRAALYAAKGYTSGKLSLAHHILEAAGLQNIGAELGYDYGAKLAIESLLMTEPDIIVSNPPGLGHAKAEEMTQHPALDYVRQQMPLELTTNKNWVCDTPQILDAVEELAIMRDKMLQTRTKQGQP